MMTRLPSFHLDQRGSAAAEMALVLPLLLALVFMTLEGANFVWNEHKLVMGVRDAARYAGRLDYSSYTCPNTIDATKETQIKNVARTGQVTGGNARVVGWGSNANDVTVTLTCASGQGGLYGVVGGNAPRVKVVAKVPYPSFVGTTLGFSSTMRMGAVAESPVMGL